MFISFVYSFHFQILFTFSTLRAISFLKVPQIVEKLFNSSTFSFSYSTCFLASSSTMRDQTCRHIFHVFHLIVCSVFTPQSYFALFFIYSLFFLHALTLSSPVSLHIYSEYTCVYVYARFFKLFGNI